MNASLGEQEFLHSKINVGHLRFLPGAASAKVNIFMGHHGWNDKTFIGKVYPPRTKKMDFLRQYATKFNSVLATSTRFALPQANELNKWISATPKSFKFSVLAPQYLSHSKDFGNDAVLKDLDSTLNRLAILNEKLAFLYFNFPSAIGLKRIDGALELLSSIPNEFPLAVSFRNQEVFRHETLHKALAELNIASVLVDNKSHHKTNLLLTNTDLVIHFHAFDNPQTNVLALNEWAKKCKSYVESGVNNIYFFATHQAPNKYLFPELLTSFKESLLGELGERAQFR
ncbi:MAG: DUF72 domain-containing protein [Bacteroidia bacterium]